MRRTISKPQKIALPWLVSLVVLLFISPSGWSQLKGQLYQDGYPYPMVKVYFEDVKPKVTSNFNGEFLLKIPNDSVPKNVVFDNYGLKIIVTNCSLTAGEMLDLGKIILPKYKQVSVEEYENLKRRNRKQCLPLYNGTTLIGYINTTQMESTSLPFHCPEGKGVSSYVLDPKTKTITIDWVSFISCI